MLRACIWLRVLLFVLSGYFLRDYYTVVIIGKDYRDLPTLGVPKRDLGMRTRVTSLRIIYVFVQADTQLAASGN